MNNFLKKYKLDIVVDIGYICHLECTMKTADQQMYSLRPYRSLLYCNGKFSLFLSQ